VFNSRTIVFAEQQVDGGSNREALQVEKVEALGTRREPGDGFERGVLQSIGKEKRKSENLSVDMASSLMVASSGTALKNVNARSRSCKTKSAKCSGSVHNLPLLNMPEDMNNDRDAVLSFAQELRRACSESGFFYLKPPKSIFGEEENREIFEAAESFFALSMEEKMKMDYAKSPQFRGYVSLGLENTKGKIDAREQVEFGVNSAPKRSEDMTHFYERLVGPNQYPSPEFEETMEKFIERMDGISRQLTRYLALSLGLEEIYFDHMFAEQPNMQMKICRYPPPSIANSESSFGVGPHTDTSFVSILLQDDVGGLQVEVEKNVWIDARPIEGYFVVNIGEMLQIMTGGYYKATPHRVLSPPSSIENNARLSIPYFWNPRLDFVAKEDGEIVKKGWTTTDEDIESHDNSAMSNRIINVYGENAFKSLARSHPQVFAKHHPDLLVRSDGTIEERKI